MPKNWADRAIMLCVIGLVAWAIIGLPALRTFWPAAQPTHAYAGQPSTNSARAEKPWLTKDAAGFFTFLLFVVGGLQVGLFMWQLWLIRESLDDAKTAAEAAKEGADTAKLQAETAQQTLKVMQNTAERQLRAYMDVRPRKVERTTIGIVAHVILVNAGQVPARRVGNNLKICWSADGNKKDFEEVEIENPDALLIVPGAEIVGGSKPLLPHEAAKYDAGEGYIYVWGRVEYSDGFGHDRWLKFCHRYNCAKPTSFAAITITTTATESSQAARAHTARLLARGPLPRSRAGPAGLLVAFAP